MELTVGAIQMESKNGDVEGNLTRATPLVEQAAERGARLICLPEFLPLRLHLQSHGLGCRRGRQRPDGAVALAEQAERLNVTVGTSFLERFGDGFRNTFVLTGPDGEYGRVYKQDVALFENFFMEGVEGSHVIETPLGRVGVGICYENLRAFLSRELVARDADIVLQPHSCPDMPGFLPPRLRERMRKNVRDAARSYAAGLGIPAVFVNKCGPFVSPSPMFPYLPLRMPFFGHTAIADSNGDVLRQVGREAAVLVETVVMDPDRKTGRPLPANGNWAVQAPAVSLWYSEFVGRAGQRSYARDQRRIAAARSGTA
jgi:N-carbamoylputrescine amidase